MTEEELMENVLKIEKMQSNYDYYEAMDLAQDAKVVAMYYDNTVALTKLYKIIGQSYEVNGELNKSFENYNKAVMHAKLNRNDSLVTALYYNLAKLTNLQNRPVEESTFFYQKIIENAKISGDVIELVRAKNNIAQIYLMKKRPESALPYLEAANLFAGKIRKHNEYVKLQYLYSYYNALLGEFEGVDKYLYLSLIHI